MPSDRVAAKPKPLVTADTRSFWAACADGILLYQRCDDCHQVQFPPRPFCTRCRGSSCREEASAGHGTVHSYTVVFRPPSPAFKDDIPYVIALVDFDEGFRIMANLHDCRPEDVGIGLRVRAVFEPLPGGGALPQVRPLE